MDIEEIKTLTDLMVTNDLSEVIIRDGEKRILLRRGTHPVIAGSSHAVPVVTTVSSGSPPAAAAASVPVTAPSAPASEAGQGRITSPMVGTFYATPDPESPPFVRVGDRVNPDTVVCIIEAMKVFNEIKAEISGTIESIDVQSGQPVEFGQVLMTVRVA